ncbi:helix-turn-helix domain-containing protein [Nitratireductor sp. B36]|uniref:helix-turn-helix domain-containing protein n=1 Tax=Nitratireductor sp. B36 TaxID=2762059 RepID=UPI00210214EB|nr:helix-turn-helix domain-containing protein [Nitratireductor sp. B36]
MREVRRSLGDPDREVIAQAVGVSKSTLASYERGESEPLASVLRAYNEKFGVNPTWLVLGAGDMFAVPPTRMERDALEPAFMKRLAGIVNRIHREAGIRLRPEDVASETTSFYNELARRVDDLSDHEEVEVVLKQVEHLLKKRLSEAVASPGTGKRSA